MDIELNYIDIGSGEPLVLLHGNGENIDYFAHQTPVFSKTHRVIAVDTRGHGKSPRGTAPFTISQFADDLKSLLDMLSIDKAILLGFSDGGNIALSFALRYPNRVSRLILNGANLSPSGVKAGTQSLIVLAWLGTVLISVFSKKFAAKKELLGLMVTQPHFDTSELSEIKIPTLVIAGSSDMIKDKHTRKIAESIPCSKLKIIDGTHFIASENSEEFNHAIYDFLG